MIDLPENEGGQAMVEYLLIVGMVVFTIMALVAVLMHHFS
jgi:Flp pilus assembly pilin Flp